MALDVSEVPASWKSTRLGDCCDVMTSSMSYTDFVRTAESVDGDSVECMGVKVSDMNLPGNEAAFVAANATKRLPLAVAARKLVPPDTVVFPKRGAAIATNKKRLTTTWTVLDPTLISLRPRNGLDARFLFFWSQTFDLRKITDPGPTPQLNKKDLLPVEITIPTSLGEQRQIAAVLSAVQRAIERQERLIALTAELKKALMHKLFIEGARGESQKNTEIGLLPESWIISPVRELCDLVSGGTPSKANLSFWNGTIPWASPKDMKLPRLSDTQDHVTQVGVDEGSRLVPPGSIFVVIRGMILMRDVPIAQAMRPMAFNQDMKALINFRGVMSEFMLYSLQNARDRLLRKVGSSAHGTRTLMTSAIEELPIAVPARSEQELVSRALRALEDKIDNHDRAQRSLRALFRALLHKLMTGEIRVHDLDVSAFEIGDHPTGAL